MANDIVIPPNFGQVPDVFKESPVDVSTFTAGIGIAWPTMTIKGKVFGVRAKGAHTEFLEPNPRGGGDIPVPSIEVIMVAASNRIAKTYYKGAFVDGQRPPPDCWSADGLTPDPGSPDKQAETCRGCPHNVMGSKISPDGKVRGKACSDNKRLALVFSDDISNEVGPIMLRLMPGSFQNYTAFVNTLASRGYAPYTFVTQLSFDTKVAHPKIQFRAMRVLNATEAKQVVEVQKHPSINEMLNDKALGAVLDPEVADDEFDSTPELPKGPVSPAPGSPFAKAKDTMQKVAEAAKADAAAKIAALEAELAKAKAEPEPEPEPVKQVKTPEQLKIEQLEADLAEARATKKVGRPRSKPVGPPASTGAIPMPGPVTPQGNGADQAEEAARPTPIGNAISARLNSLMRPKT